jgi:hypothetical protein
MTAHRAGKIGGDAGGGLIGMDGQTTQSIAAANRETGALTEGQVEAIIKAGRQRLTWPAALG